MDDRRLRWTRGLTGLALALAAATAAADATLLDDQRAIFRNAWASAERGDWVVTRNETELLASYVLWPDLRGRYLEAAVRTAPRREIEAFLEREGTSRPARSLRYRWAKHLYREGAADEFLAIYDRYYAALGNTELDCMAVAAEIKANQPINGALALSLWNVGHSQHDACDPVFAWLNDAGLVGEKEIRARFRLAIEAREFGLARWLAKRLSAKEQATAARWIALRDRPADALADLTRVELPGFASEVSYGIGRLAREDTTDAMALWQSIKKHHNFPAPLAGSTTERIALIAAWRHEPHAAEFMARVPAASASLELREWQVRHALRAGDNSGVISAIDALPANEAGKARWQYWRAVATAATDPDSAAAVFERLASDRSYYGFLAADRSGREYALDSQDIERDPDVQTTLLARPGMRRAIELYAVGLAGRGRSAWETAVRGLAPPELRQAALLAADAGWNDRAIATLARSGDFDVLHLRYPTPWLDDFAAASRGNGVALAWAYGIARSESLFMTDVRSPAGAVGLMQLMPRTGRATAKSAGVQYRGLTTLTDAASNIRIGTRYLAELALRFSGHEALATAAYNAGPHRVERWLEGADGMAADIWVETIPFDETRGYVQRVLAARAVFHWRLTDAERRLSQSLPPIPAREPRVAGLVR